MNIFSKNVTKKYTVAADPVAYKSVREFVEEHALDETIVETWETKGFVVFTFVPGSDMWTIKLGLLATFGEHFDVEVSDNLTFVTIKG